MSEVSIPSFDDFYTPTIQALQNLDGSGTNQEIYDQVASILQLTDEQIQMPLKTGSSRGVIDFRLGWAKTQLKTYGLLENPQTGVWALTPEGQNTVEVDASDLRSKVKAILKQREKQKKEYPPTDSADDIEVPDIGSYDEDLEWRDALFNVIKNMDATAFERLCKRLLRESGFAKVENTPPSRDGGIDGWGILPINDFVTFRVVFQCKRYGGSVGPDVVQALRGAMPGNADRGLIITTGHFTTGAKKEAAHEHKAPIELVDGEALVDRLKALKLGVSTKMVEQVTVNPDFFANI